MVARSLAQHIWIGDFADFAQIHHDYAGANGTHNRKIV
jgi:hypothetical protein